MAHLVETVRKATGTARGALDGGSDGALVAGVRAGDDAAFEAIYDRYHRNLLAFCRHMLGSREEAEDVLQHVFLAAYRDLRDGAGVIHLKPWLYTLARNRCVSVLRGRREEVSFDDDAVATDGLVAHVDRRAELRALVRDLQRLPAEQRAALVLFELGDQSHEEIAAVLGVRREKVKALVFQAREALMGWRAARAAPCGPVREQLASLTGSALRRGSIRRHVEQCPGCAEYEAEVRRQRAALAIVLPVAPAAGLKAAVLGSALGGAGVAASGAATGAAGGIAALGANGLATKVLVIAAVAGGAGATGYVAVEGPQHHAAPAQHAQRAASPAHAGVAARAPAPPLTRTIAATRTRPTTDPAKRAAQANAHARRHGRALGTTAPRGKVAAPGRLKAPRSPARGKAVGAAKATTRSAAAARAKPAFGRTKPRPTRAVVAKPKPAKVTAKPGAAKPAGAKRSPARPANSAAPPGRSPAGPPGRAGKPAAGTP